jgi:threonylcarbamoyladenosine tRNA methylthiotransferase MtaB
MKAAFYTLGCKVNQYETEAVAQEFLRHGYLLVSEDEEADVYVVNSCSVTREADRKSRQYLRRMKRRNPQAVTVLMGCYPQTCPGETEELGEADIVLGTEDKLSAVGLVEQFLADRGRIDKLTEKDENGAPLRPSGPSGCPVLETGYNDIGTVVSMLGSRRALIKIQEGCNRFCSYCIIPHARGPIRSRSPRSIEKEAVELLKSGCREIVLAGINTALYGLENGFKNDMEWSAADKENVRGIEIVVKLLNDLPGDFRIRLNSLEPTVVDKDYLASLLKYDKLAHHAHLSVQSGSDSVIASMNRHYTRADYLQMVRTLKSFDKDYGITTDIITGFPGEKEEDFEESLRLVDECGFLHVHAFPYSERPGTPAASMPGKVPVNVRKERVARLIKAGDAASLRFREGLAGTVQRVLPEECCGDGMWRGRASNYCNVWFEAPAEPDLTSTFVDVTIEKTYKDGVFGRTGTSPESDCIADCAADARKGEQMSDCIFCKIANGGIPTNMVYEDDKIAAFRDLEPQAPEHVLIVPKKHIQSLDQTTEEDAELLAHIMLKIKEIAAILKLENGYRVVINTGSDGGQTVPHLHVHLLGKRAMAWPPG